MSKEHDTFVADLAEKIQKTGRFKGFKIKEVLVDGTWKAPVTKTRSGKLCDIILTTKRDEIIPVEVKRSLTHIHAAMKVLYIGYLYAHAHGHEVPKCFIATYNNGLWYPQDANAIRDHGRKYYPKW